MKYLPALLILLLPLFANAQGCSDAGFCTMGAMKPDQPYNKRVAVRLRSAELSFYRGTTLLTPVIYVATADLNFAIKGKNTFQVKLPFQAVTGRLANTQGLSDISLCFTRNIYSSDKFSLNLSLGTKIPTNASNKATDAGLPLPMYYQTSLGSYDAIAGVSLINRKWLFATGVQVALTQNKNEFVWSSWAGVPSELKTYVDKYNQAKDLKRGTDIMLRVERNFRFSKFNFTLGALPIYRIVPDQFTRSGTEANSAITRVKPKDVTTGLALSVLGTVGYNFDVRSGVRLLIGHKITNRDLNPDGLTRELVSSITYVYRF